ncbi:MAG: hypothetical protein ACKOE6_11195, partial [Flammeovirgaceae bacterium]
QEIDYKEITKNLDVTFNGAFSLALKSSTDNVYSDTYSYLQANYFTGNLEFNPNEIKREMNKSARIGSVNELDLSFLTNEQRVLAVPFLNNLLAQEDLEIVKGLANSFNIDVASSSLSNEHKYQLLALGSAVGSAVKVIEETIIKASSVGRSQGVDVKGALQAGVIGLVGGAIVGGKAGCAGGTVAFPGLGTATGCVGGAVIGGALGFIGGVAESILQDIIFG